MAKLKSSQDILLMRDAGQLAAKTLQYLGDLVKPGISTEALDKAAYEYIKDHGAIPSPLNYRGFPKSICTSINDVICHGIPSDKEILQEGDIINIDVTVTLKEFHGDTSKTYIVGNTCPPDRLKVYNVAQESIARGIAVIEHAKRIGDIGYAIQSYAEGEGCGVVRDFVGHGIGKGFHEEPQILHYGKPNTGIKIMRGMCFTVEPMINGKDWRHRMMPDRWTAKTVDGSPSAQFEHTLAIVSGGIEILTALKGDAIMERVKELGGKVMWPNNL